MEIKKNKTYLSWVESKNVDKELKKELCALSEKGLKFAFENKLSFGTAGIRGILGPGPGYFNIFTIKLVTRAYARLLRDKYGSGDKAIVIGHDNRKNSALFAQEVANILSSYDITAYLFKENELRPTPVVSFLTTKLGCVGGIVITASHNPKEYNGYKIYNEFGCQLIDSDTEIISEYMSKHEDILDWTYIPNSSKIITVTQEQEEEYEKMINDLMFFKKEKKDFSVIYSAVNGTGSRYVPRILKEAGFNVIVVKEHEFEDPTFKNVGNPNPEFESAWIIPFEYAKKHPEASIIVITDPDADRLGVAIKHNEHWIRLNGNETGPLLILWRLQNMKDTNVLPKNPAMYSSFVTSDLGDRIANEKFGVTVIKTLTGFKWMASEILKEPQRNFNFVFAYEESFGYVIDKSTKDKDGIQAAVTICEAAWYIKAKENKTLIDKLNDIYSEFGYYNTDTINLNFYPNEVEEKLKPIMNKLRTNPFSSLAGVELEYVEDYKNGMYNMPGQDLLKFYFKDKSWFAIRPSGTEPKIKIYFVIVDENESKTKKKTKLFIEDLSKFLDIKF